MKAAERFDEKKNFRFISFAVWWIRQSILQALANQSRVTRVPLNRVGLIHKVGKMKDQLEQKFGRLPTAAEIAVELKIDKPLVEEALRIDAKPVSLEDQLDDTGRRAVKDTIRDDSSPLPDEISIDSSLTRNIEQYLDILTPRERTVIAHYFGLEDKVPKNLDQIGKIMRVTRERVRQLKENGLKRLKEAGLERLFTELVH